MNGKKAKMLRRGCKHFASIKKIPQETCYVEQKHPRLVAARDVLTREVIINPDGTTKTVTINHITRWLGECQRRFYQLTKRKYKNG